MPPLQNARLAALIALLPLLAGACGFGSARPEPSPAATPAPAAPAPPAAPAATPASASTAANPAHEVHGRISGLDTATAGAWSAGIVEFRPTDPEVAVVAAAPAGPDGRFSIVFGSYQWDVPYAVIAFRDANRNGLLDAGEDFVGGEARVGEYRGKNLFLIARAGTFVGDRPLELDQAEFLLDIRAR